MLEKSNFDSSSHFDIRGVPFQYILSENVFFTLSMTISEKVSFTLPMTISENVSFILSMTPENVSLRLSNAISQKLYPSHSE